VEGALLMRLGPNIAGPGEVPIRVAYDEPRALPFRKRPPIDKRNGSRKPRRESKAERRLRRRSAR